MSEIRQAVEKAYKEMPSVFSGGEIIERVRELVGRPKMFQDTALRGLRQLRKAGQVDYKVVEKKLSQYEKKEVSNV